MVKANCPLAGGQGDRADVANMGQIEFQADQEQQHGDAYLGQQVDLVDGVYLAEAGRPHRDTDHDVGDEHGLTQAHKQGADQCGNHQQLGDCREGTGHGGAVVQAIRAGFPSR